MVGHSSGPDLVDYWEGWTGEAPGVGEGEAVDVGRFVRSTHYFDSPWFVGWDMAVEGVAMGSRWYYWLG